MYGIYNNKLILDDFKHGLTISQIADSIYKSAKRDGIKLTLKEARGRVEEVVLKDYLSRYKNEAV